MMKFAKEDDDNDSWIVLEKLPCQKIQGNLT